MSSNLMGRWWLFAVIGLAVTAEAFAQKTPIAEPTSPGRPRRVTAPPYIQKLIDEGDVHQSEQDFQKAREKYFEAHEKVKELPDIPSTTSLAVETALKVARMGVKLPDDQAQLDAMAKLLDDAGKRGTPHERARIDVVAADVALRAGKPKKAIELLHGADWDQFETRQQPILKYNLGRAYEIDGQDVEAFRRYGDAVRLNPQFSLAADRATESAWKLIQQDPSRTRATSMQLAKLGLANRGAQFALTTLSKPEAERDHNVALALLFQSWAATYPGPAEFIESPSFRSLSGLADKNEQRDIPEAVKALVQAPLETNPADPWQIPLRLQWFARQNGDVRSACSAFAVAVGKWSIADARKEPQGYQALTRFLIAWSLDRENIDAATELARVLTLEVPGITPALVDKAVQGVWDEKTILFFAAKNLHEWNQLETYHTFLAMIFERREAWGSGGEPRSAIFQWQHALIAHAEALRLDPETPPAPGLHEHLAKAWLGARKNEFAFEEFLRAADGFLKCDDHDTAWQLLTKTRELGVAPSPDQKRRVDELTRKLKAPR